jgi:lipocalin
VTDILLNYLQYGRGNNGTITVLNSQRTGSPTGPAETVRGVAKTPNPCQPGQLLLKLDNVPREGSYWVLALGPKIGGLYQWAIVSDEGNTTLFILARNLATFKTKYEKTALRKAAKLGFVGDNKPVKSYQEKDCLY